MSVKISWIKNNKAQTRMSVLHFKDNFSEVLIGINDRLN